MSSAKKQTLNAVSVKLDCGSSLSALFRRRHRHRHRHRNESSSSGSLNTTTTFSSSSAIETPPHYCLSSSEAEEPDIKSLRAVQGFGRLGGQSVAVEKESEDPYLDFRRSMLQMILEKELYSKDDLRELLNCFLQLNSPYYHALIVRAFKEIWSGAAFCSPSAHYF